MRLTRGWHTDLGVLRHTGSRIDEYPDHVVVTTPSNPAYHWGNFVLVTEPGGADDADHWVAVFRRAHPRATHLAFGLPARPAEAAWRAHGIEIGTDQVLFTTRLPEQRPLDAGYTARPFDSDEVWTEQVRSSLEENARTGQHDPVEYEVFARAQAADRRRLVEAGHAQWFGALDAAGALVADLGIVDCGEAVARYQAVQTDAAHRRRGLAGHLLGLAARWAAEQGCDQWVIVTETTNPAGRLYQSVGFVPDAVQVSAYRKAAS